MAESTAIALLREEMAPVRSEFGLVLPGHISADKFAQVCITAVENNPALLDADRQSFKVACLNAATDGLLPDKREGAFVIFNAEVDVRREGSAAVFKEKRKMVVWMPMITGILKKAYQTNKVASIAVEMVHKNDVYRRAAGDNAEIVHEPLDFGDRGPVIGGYAIVHMRDGGEPYREVMSLADIEKVRSVSKKKDSGPWADFWDEMAKKTILRRTLKRVPLSAEVDQVLSRDDAFYNMSAGALAHADVPLIAAVPRGKLASNRPHLRRERTVAPEQTDAPAADPTDAQVGDVGLGESAAGVEEEATEAHSQAVVDAVSAIRAATTPSELAEAIHAASQLQSTDGERDWIDTVAKQRTADIVGVGAFRLQAVISTVTGLREYEDVGLWEADILAKLSAIKQPALGAFWEKNLGYVIDAGENGFDEHADRVLDVARGKGLSTEIGDGR